MDNIKYIYKYNNEGTTIHSSNSKDINVHIVCENNNLICINRWPFINHNTLITPEFNIDIFPIIQTFKTDSCFLLICEVHNAGHLIVNILQQLHYYINNNFNCIILCPKYISNNIFIIGLISKFIDINKIIFIDEDHVYEIQKLFICHTGFTYNWYYSDVYIINETNETDIKIIENLNLKYQNDIDNNILMLVNIIFTNIINNNLQYNKIQTYDKITLIKTIDNVDRNSLNANKTHSLERSFSNDYNIYFQTNNFKQINPIDYKIDELCYILSKANVIVFSWGCISYLNKMFVNNKDVQIILLAHIGYNHEYNILQNCGHFIPLCKNASVILNLDSVFNDTTKNALDKVILRTCCQ
jgi:hypothetical protein